MAIPSTRFLATTLLFTLPILIFAQPPPCLDPPLQAAEKAPKTIKVRQDGSGEFKTIKEAVATIPKNNTVRTIIAIGPGVYKEKVLVDGFKPFVTFYGTPGPELPKITFDGTAAKYGTMDSASLVVEADYFVMVNIHVENSAPEPTYTKPNEQAVAMEIAGNKAAFYNCRFSGFQDTLLDDHGTHYFKNCIIEGTVDFIFGRGKSLYEGCTLRSLSKGGAMVASGREKAEWDTGFSFVHCNITGTGRIALGRNWRTASRAVFSLTYMDANVIPEGWELKRDVATTNVYYAEYKCTGPGAATDRRLPYVKKLTDAEAKPFLDTGFINGNAWLIPPPKL